MKTFIIIVVTLAALFWNVIDTFAAAPLTTPTDKGHRANTHVLPVKPDHHSDEPGTPEAIAPTAPLEPNMVNLYACSYSAAGEVIQCIVIGQYDANNPPAEQ